MSQSTKENEPTKIDTTPDRNEGIAIVGLGGFFPDANSVPEFWKNICDGHVAIRDVPPERWDPEMYYSENRSAPEKTYCRIGGFMAPVEMDARKFRIPPKTLASVDDVQKLALMAVAAALEDAGLEVFSGRGGGKTFDRERTAVILGNSMGGEWEDLTSLRIWFPVARKALQESAVAKALPQETRRRMLDELEANFKAHLPPVTEDSMPGELSNCIAGRVANAFDLRGVNFTTDAACAASMAALKTASMALQNRDVDMAIVGGVDKSMDPPTFVKFSKIGALSGKISAPFDSRADGFVMGEGVGIMVLKRLSDAERDNDRIYAVVRAVGAASDGKGKGMTAPNPRGQRLAVERAFDQAGVSITSVGLFEAHGTSTVVGDATEARVLTDLLKEAGAEKKGVPIGSVKSMIGHLKSAAGAASVIKAALALHHKILPPSANFVSLPEDSPIHEGFLKVCTETRPWKRNGSLRRAAVSAFGFGGTNFHVVLEEYAKDESTPILIDPTGRSVSTPASTAGSTAAANASASTAPAATGSIDTRALTAELTKLFAESTGYEIDDLDPSYELESDLGIDTVKQAEILAVIRQRYGLSRDDTIRLSDTPTLASIVDYVASQHQPVASDTTTIATPPAETAEPQAVVESNEEPTVLVFGGSDKADVVQRAEAALQSATSFPSDLTSGRNDALTAPTRLAFVADSLKAVSGKLAEAGRRKAKILAAQGTFLSEIAPLFDQGGIAMLFPGQGSQFVGMMRDLAVEYPIVAETFREADEILEPLIGGKLTDTIWAETKSEAEMVAADLALRQTEICQPAMLAADTAMYRLLGQYGIRPSVVAGHSLGEYAACVAAGVLSFADAMYAVSARGREMAEVKVEDNGKMASVAGPAERVEEVLREIDGYVIAANKNCHTQTVIAGNTQAVEMAVQRFGELGIEAREIPVSHAFHSEIVAPASKPLGRVLRNLDIRPPQTPILTNIDATYYPQEPELIAGLLERQLAAPVEFIAQIERMYADGARIFIEVGPRRATTGFVRNVMGKRQHLALATVHPKKPGTETFLEALAAFAVEGVPVDFDGRALSAPADEPVADVIALASHSVVEPLAVETIVVTGTSVLLPRAKPVGDGDPLADLFAGSNFITPIDEAGRAEMVAKNVVRLDKTGGLFERIEDLSDVLQLAARIGKVDLVGDYGLDAGFDDALDTCSRLAIAAGIETLRDAGMPLLRRYRTTSTGKKLPDRWALPPEIAATTGVIFASAFAGVDRIIDDVSRQVAARCAGDSAARIERLFGDLADTLRDPIEAKRLREAAVVEAATLRDEASLYTFNRKFLFRALNMGHAQLAQTILAQGPNTAINAACSSGTQGLALASDWIRHGRCERVLVISADDVTNERMLPWFGAGFLASGAASVDPDLERAATPFGAGRNGMILGAGATGILLERDCDAQARGLQPIAELLTTRFGNSAFHGTRLDETFIKEFMSEFVGETAEILGWDRATLARRAFFMSHETYTPARGGSASAEVAGLRHAFGDAVTDLLIANTKGYTGHSMGAAIEDVITLKALQRRVVPPIANLTDVDPLFTDLRFARGDAIDADVAIHFAAGFGSQVALAAFRRRADHEARLEAPEKYQAWLDHHTGRDGVGLEVVSRTLRVAEQGGSRAWELGIPSLEAVPSQTAATKTVVAEETVAQTPAPMAIEPIAAAPSADSLLAEIQALFAEQTGYDVDDLDPAFELEADLGVDTVKQAELLSLIRERYALAKDDAFKLSDVPTLAAVVEYVQSQMPAAESAASADAAPVITAPVVTAPDVSEPVAGAPIATAPKADLVVEIQSLFAEHTGYDLDDLDPAFELEADLGIDTVKQAELLSIIRERYGLVQDDAFKLSDVPTLNAVTEYVISKMPSDAVAAEPVASEPVIAESAASEPVVAAPVVTAPSDNLLAEIQGLFAEQTGYDLDDLDPAFELEADLGIDTVKQAELLSVLRERYSLEKDDAFKLSDVPTLTAVVAYVASKMPATQATAPVTTAVAAEAPPANETPAIDSRFTAREVAAVRLHDGLPASRTFSGRRVAIAGGDETWRAAAREALSSRGAQVVLFTNELDSEAALQRRLGDVGGAPVDDLIYLAGESIALDPSAIEAQVEEMFLLVRAFARARGDMADAGLLVVGRSGGAFGFGSADATGVALGALAGMIKSLAREWPEAACLVADLDHERSFTDGFDEALDAWSRQAPTEIAWHRDAIWTLRRLDTALSSATPLDLQERPVVVATGGARGVTHRVLMEMARRRKLRIEILARTDGVAPADSPLSGKNEAEQKELARAAVTAAGERSTPLAIKRWIGKQASRVEVAQNLEALRQLGSEVNLLVCDVADDEALDGAARTLRSRHATIDILLHGAGCEESKLIADKDDEAFRRIFAPKARAGLRLSELLQPRRVVTMGSVAGRFGNAGQTDYAAANELLAAWSRHGARGVLNLAWTAWDEVGMAMEGSTKRILESAGVDLLPPDVGAKLATDLIFSSAVGDAVVAGKLGQFDETEPDVSSDELLRATDNELQPDRPWIFDAIEQIDGTATYIRRLDASRDPGLDDHRIDGLAVLPGVFGVELMTCAAEHHTGRSASALENVEFSSPLKLYRDQPVEARVEVRIDGDTVTAKLVSVFTTPAGKTRRREHFAARIIFGERSALNPPAPWELELPRDPKIDAEQIYSRYFHGPRFQVIESLEATGEDGATARPALDQGAMFAEEKELASSPRLREAGFQAAGVWEMLELGRMALPSGIDRIELGGPIPAGTALWIEARKRSTEADGSRFDIWVRDENGTVYDVMHGYHTAVLRDLEPEERFEPARGSDAVVAWLFVDIDEVRQLLERDTKAAVERYLSAAEQARFAELKTDKRRADWLSGRIAAKRLIRETRFRNEGAIVTFPAISILADELGAPEVQVIGEPLPGPQVSISHGAGVAVAFLSPESQQRPGIDVERVEARASSFLNDYFTDVEREQAAADARPERAFTARWAVKEAFLKALGIGARVDFRDVEVRQTGDSWRVALRGEAHDRAEAIGAGEPSVEVQQTDERVVARVLLPTNGNGSAKIVTTTETNA